VAHAYNPSYSGDRDQEDRGLKPAWANSSWDPISEKLNPALECRSVVEHTWGSVFDPSTKKERKGREKKRKLPNPKKAGRVAQVVERLPSKYEALSSNSKMQKKKKPKGVLSTELLIKMTKY
jgi:hypothetical protein